MADKVLRLVGDIGGTNARFGLAWLGDGAPVIGHISHLRVSDFPTAQEGLAHYLDGLVDQPRPTNAVLAVAGPVVNGKADLTNAQGWSLDSVALAGALGLRAVTLINDFAGPSLAVPLLGPADLRPIGCSSLIDPSQTISLIGPGTGTGVGGRAVYGDQVAILVTEGGHIGFAPSDAVERELLRILAARFGRVSIERILCGQGIVNLHQALAEIDGRALADMTPIAITDAALAGEATALATMERFFAILGSVAGDLALIQGARGGVLLAGGILPRMVGLLEASSFRARFEDKGRLSPLLRATPTNLLVADDVALLGAAGSVQ